MISVPTGEDPPFIPVDGARFRQIMRNPVSSVAIVATGEEGRRAGCTVTAVCSLSDSPPSLLVCLNRQSFARQAIVTNKRFTINYLAESQREDADHLAGRFGLQGEEKFNADRWQSGPGGLPCLRDALAVLVCDLAHIIEFGSHSILCGTIQQAIFQELNRPLLYGQGRYIMVANQ